MTAMQVAERMTAEEFLAAGEPERGWPVSLVGGEVVVNDPSILHGSIQKAILLALESWIRAGRDRGWSPIRTTFSSTRATSSSPTCSGTQRRVRLR